MNTIIYNRFYLCRRCVHSEDSLVSLLLWFGSLHDKMDTLALRCSWLPPHPAQIHCVVEISTTTWNINTQ